jgi:hypothetical protein
MVGLMTRHIWMSHMARRIQRLQGAVRARRASSSGSPLAPPKASPCVLDLLGHARPQSHLAMESTI